MKIFDVSGDFFIANSFQELYGHLKTLYESVGLISIDWYGIDFAELDVVQLEDGELVTKTIYACEVEYEDLRK